MRPTTLAFTAERAAVALAPRSADAYLQLGSRLELASQAVNTAGALAETRPAQAAEAELAYRMAVRLDPTNAEGFYQFGMSLRAFGPSRSAEAVALLETAAIIEPDHAGVASTVGYYMLASGASGRRRGLAILARRVSAGVWPPGRWQHPAEYFDIVPKAPLVHPRAPYACLLSPLERAAPAMGAEAMTTLPQYSIQREGLARPHGGWRELDVWLRCGLASYRRSGGAGTGTVPPELVQTCATLRMVKESYAFVQGALFSAIAPGTTLDPHCGPTNGRLVLHVGLKVPHPGRARLRLGRPSALDSPADRALLRQLGFEGSEPKEVAWAEGHGFVWEDSTCHEVLWRANGAPGSGAVDAPPASSFAGNFTLAEPRIILLLLLLHPAMTRVPVCASTERS